MAVRQSARRSRRAVAIGLADQARDGKSHKVLSRPGFPDFVFAFHQGEEIGPRMLARISKHTGLSPEDL
jgi:predicted RNA binding protein YcfA (HicA-like mRNA interferase family)